MYKVKEVAEIASVSVRTLHHYDHIGLLKPSHVTNAGYRLYTDENLERLQQIMFFKEMGFSLLEIKEIVDRPDFDRLESLQLHKELLIKKKDRLEQMILTVEKTINSVKGDGRMSNKDRFKGFDRKEIEEHQRRYSDEAKQKYGEAIVEESEKRVAQYGDDEWNEVQNQGNAIYYKIIDRMDKGPEDEVVQEAVGEWQQHITDNFYECTNEILRGLGELYVTDIRFTKNLNKFSPGFAEFLSEAISIYCDKHASEK